MAVLLNILNVISKISSLGILSEFFKNNPKTGASTGATIMLSVITVICGHYEIGITADQASALAGGIGTIGSLFMAHFVPSPLKAK